MRPFREKNNNGTFWGIGIWTPRGYLKELIALMPPNHLPLEGRLGSKTGKFKNGKEWEDPRPNPFCLTNLYPKKD